MHRLYLALHGLAIRTNWDGLRRFAARRLLRGRLMRDVMRNR
jgi:hypothetical protein